MRLHALICRLVFPALAALAFLCGPALAAEPAPSCPEEMDDAQLQGRWEGRLQDSGERVLITLGPHPEWKAMVKGRIERKSEQQSPQMAGDVDDGTVTLEESRDGQRISATWFGQVVEGSCGREIRGEFLEGEDRPARPFVLRKLAP
ncbi:hypothetical protein [Comamonas composti]|uniref:hypothetical protein n=1 Tax=Comamonas composti TaxID=408558 RepID=UPI00040ED86D|nr:hypothetical protein [Comamonas composti]